MSTFDRFPLENPAYDYREKEPFFTEALPCESCGKPVDSRQPAPWCPWLQVGDCCMTADPDTYPDLEEPVCENLYRAIVASKTVREVAAAFDAHLKQCDLCRAGNVQVAARVWKEAA